MKDNDRQHSKKGLHNIEIGISFCPLGFSLSGISAGYFHIAFFRFYQYRLSKSPLKVHFLTKFE